MANKKMDTDLLDRAMSSVKIANELAALSSTEPTSPTTPSRMKDAVRDVVAKMTGIPMNSTFRRIRS